MYKIIDCSENNSIKSWDIVKDNVDGVILRIGYRGYAKAGKLKMDAKFDKYVKRLISLRIPWGVYMITQATCSLEGKEEYEWVKSVLSNYDTTDMVLGIWCDSEYSGSATRTGRADTIDKYLRTSAVCGFCDCLKRDNKYGGIYASESWLTSMLIWDAVKGYNLWVANYTTKPKKDCDLWQRTSKGIVGGVNYYVDVSECYIDITKSYIAHTNPVNPYPEPTRTLKRTFPTMSGSDVRWLQWELNTKGYNLKEDGKFGANTEIAVKHYQNKYGLVTDGKVGGATRKCLKND